MVCVTISCPESMVGGAYADAVETVINGAIGGSNSFGGATFKRNTVNYAVLSFTAPDSLVDALSALEKVVIHNVASGDGPNAVYNRITVYHEDDTARGLVHLAAMGLTRIPVEHP